MTDHDATLTSIRQLRMSMRNSLDPRAARTRQAILDAVHELAGQSSGGITVGDIVERAKISRSSFYTQFAGIDELALNVLSEALDDMSAGDQHRDANKPPAPIDATRAGMIDFVQNVEDNRLLYASVLSLPFTYLTYTRFIDALAAHIAESIEVAGSIQGRIHIRSASTYVAGGLLAVLRLWLHGELDVTADVLVDELMALLPQALVTPQ